jgi:hypothetical protein
MKFHKGVVAMLSVVVCGLFAFSIGLSAQPSRSVRIGKAAPLADVEKFGSAFTEHLNQAIRDRDKASQRKNWIAGRKVYKNFVDYYLISSAKAVAKQDIVQLSGEDLKQLGDLVKGRFDEAIRAKSKSSSLGEAQITADFVTGKVFNK